MLAMFIALRVGVGVVGISLPIILVLGGKLFFDIPVAGSMSAYYHANPACALPREDLCKQGKPPCSYTEHGQGQMRNWFVGNLFFIGAAMFLIKGFSRQEDWALNIAGIAAPVVGLNPMEWPCPRTFLSLHFIAAAVFFLSVAFTAIVCSEKTLKEMPQEPNRARIIRNYRAVYMVLAILMVALPVAGLVFTFKSGYGALGLETGGVWAFGAYWLVKTRELHHSQVEKRIISGQLRMNPRKLR
jgi:hypothetical protein